MKAAQQYERVTNPFGAPGKYYGPTGHRGADYSGSAGSPIYSPVSGKVIAVGRTAGLGTYVVVQVGDHYFGWAHVANPIAVGTWVSVDDIIGNVAGYADDHGSAWTGPHIHISYSANRLGIVSGAVSDPAAFIRTTIATQREEHDVPDAIQLAFDTKRGGEVWLIRPGSAHHQEDRGQVDRARDVLKVPIINVPAGAEGDGLVAAWLQAMLLPELANNLIRLTRQVSPPGTTLR